MVNTSMASMIWSVDGPPRRSNASRMPTSRRRSSRWAASCAFTGAALDRAGDGRRQDRAWLERQRAHPAARALVAGDRGLLVRDGRLELVPLASLNGAEPILLGLDEQGPVYAYDEDPVHDGLPPMVGAGGA